MEAFTDVWLALNAENMHAENITQDVLLLSGSNDHFIPIKMHQKQIDALVHARSVTDRIFTKHDQAQIIVRSGIFNFCLMLFWIGYKRNRY